MRRAGPLPEESAGHAESLLYGDELVRGERSGLGRSVDADQSVCDFCSHPLERHYEDGLGGGCEWGRGEDEGGGSCSCNRTPEGVPLITF